jgi:hypothetical protein
VHAVAPHAACSLRPPWLQVVRDGRVDVTLELPGSACCICLLDCRQGGALLGMQDDSGGKDIAYALDNGEVQVWSTL